jgi:Malectin domain
MLRSRTRPHRRGGDQHRSSMNKNPMLQQPIAAVTLLTTALLLVLIMLVTVAPAAQAWTLKSFRFAGSSPNPPFRLTVSPGSPSDRTRLSIQSEWQGVAVAHDNSGQGTYDANKGGMWIWVPSNFADDDPIGVAFGSKDTSGYNSANGNLMVIYWRKGPQTGAPGGLHVFNFKGNMSPVREYPWGRPSTFGDVNVYTVLSDTSRTWKTGVWQYMRWDISPYRLQLWMSSTKVLDTYASEHAKIGPFPAGGVGVFTLSLETTINVDVLDKNSYTWGRSDSEVLTSAGWQQLKMVYGSSISDSSFSRTMESNSRAVLLKTPGYGTITWQRDTTPGTTNRLNGASASESPVALDVKFTLAVKSTSDDDPVGCFIGASAAELAGGADADFYALYWRYGSFNNFAGGLYLLHVKGKANAGSYYPFFSIGSTGSVTTTILWSDTSLRYGRDYRAYTFRIVAGPSKIVIYLDDSRIAVVDTTSTGGVLGTGFGFFVSSMSAGAQFGHVRFGTPTMSSLSSAGIHYSSPRSMFHECYTGTCTDGLVCDPLHHVCKRDLHEACAATIQCAQNFECYAGKCRRRLLDPCTTGTSPEDCGEDLSCQSTDNLCYTLPRILDEPCSAASTEVCGADDAWKCQVARSGQSTCGCQGDLGFVRGGSNRCGTCGTSSECGLGACVFGKCICHDGFVKTHHGVCVEPINDAECVRGSRALKDGKQTCVCPDKYTYGGILGGCRACATDYVPGVVGPAEVGGTCKEPTVCKFSNLIPGCEILSDENEPWFNETAPERILELYSNVDDSERTQRDRDVREMLESLIEIRGNITLIVYLENDDTFESSLTIASNTSIVLAGDASSPNSIKWKMPNLEKIRELRVEESSVAALPGSVFPSLHTVERVALLQNTRLVSVFLPLLTSVTTILEAVENPLLEQLLLPQLIEAGEFRMSLHSSPAMKVTPLSASLSTVTSLEVSLPAGVASASHADINEHLAALLPGLESVGSVEIFSSEFASATFAADDYAFADVQRVAFSACPNVQWVSIPGAASSISNSIALEFVNNKNLELVYDPSSSPQSDSAAASSNATYSDITVVECPKLAYFAMCSATDSLTFVVASGDSTLCCETLDSLTRPFNSSLNRQWVPDDNPTSNCNPSCELVLSCDADTNKLRSTECAAIVPPIGPVQCEDYMSSADIVFDASTQPLTGGALAFLTSLKRMPYASVTVAQQESKSTLALKSLEEVGGSLQFIDNAYSQISIPLLATTSINSTLNVTGNTNLVRLDLPGVCVGQHVSVVSNRKLRMDVNSICASGDTNWTGVTVFVDNPASLVTMEVLDAFSARFNPTDFDDFNGNGGCIVPEPNCKAISTSLLQIDEAFLSDQSNLEFLSNVREIRATGVSFVGIASLPKLLQLQTVYGGYLELMNGTELTAGFAPSLSSVEGAVRVVNNPNLESFRFAFKSLASSGGVVVTDNAVLNDNLEGFAQLRTLSGELTIANNDMLSSIRGLFSLNPSSDGPFLSSVRIANCDQLTSLHGMEHVVVDSGPYRLRIEDNAKLADISALSQDSGGVLYILNNPELKDLSPVQDRTFDKSRVSGNGACMFVEPGCSVFQGTSAGSLLTLPDPSITAADVATLTRIEAHVRFNTAPYTLPLLETISGNLIVFTASTVSTEFPLLRHVIGSVFVSAPNPASEFSSWPQSSSNADGALVTEGMAFTDGTSIYGTTLTITAVTAAFMKQSVFDTVSELHCSLLFDGTLGSFALPATPNVRIIDGSVHIINSFVDQDLGASTAFLQTVEQIQGNLILAHTAMTTLPGMSALMLIDGSITLASNDQLVSTTGSFSVAQGLQLGNDLVVRSNALLTDVNCFAQLSPPGTSVSGRVVVENNDVLTSVAGLSNIGDVVGDIIVRDNAALVDWSGLDAAFRAQATRDVTISDTQVRGNGRCTTPMPGCAVLVGDIVMNLEYYHTSSSAPGAIVYNDTMPLPGFWKYVSTIVGDITVVGYDASNAGALAAVLPSAPLLTRVAGSVSFSNCHSSAQCFDAFGQVPLFIGGSLSIRDSVAPSIRGLSRVQRIGADLHIERASTLFSLLPLNETAEIGGDVNIIDCKELLTLEWFVSLTKVQGSLLAQDNENLRSINLNPSYKNANIVRGTVTAAGGPACTSILLPDSYAGTNLNASCIVYQGPALVVDTLADATAPLFWPTIEHIDTSLTISGTVVLPFTPSLLTVGGDLRLTGNRLVSSVGFGVALTTIQGHLRVEETVDFYFMPGNGFRSLVEVTGSVSLRQNANLEVAQLRSLARIGEHLLVESNPALMSLDGLSSLRFIGQSLLVRDNAQLPNLRGLDTVTDFGRGGITIMDNAILKNLHHLPGATASITLPEGTERAGLLAGDVWIQGNPELEQLSLGPAGGLNTIEHIDGVLSIIANPKLQTLQGGFDSLTVVADHLIIRGCDSLISLSGLDKLWLIGTRLEIANNDALVSVTGLDAVSAIGSHDPSSDDTLNTVLEIRGNPELTDLSGLARTDVSLQVMIKGHAVLRDNEELDSLFGLFSTAFGADTVPLNVEGSVVVAGNAVCRAPEAGCVKFENDKLVYSPQSASAQPFFWKALKVVTGELEITVPVLTSSLLPKLQRVGGLTLTTSVASCTGAFPALATVDGNLVVSGNPSLAAIDGATFSALTHVGGFIRVQQNDLLSDASGILNRLVYLTDPQPELYVQGNAFECFSILENAGCQLFIVVGDEPLRVDSSEVGEAIWSSLIHVEGRLVFESRSSPPTPFAVPAAPKLRTMRGSLTIGAGVTSISGLAQLQFVQGITVESSARITDLTGFASLDTIQGSLRVDAGPTLVALFASDYNGCKSITEDLEFLGASASTSFTTIEVPALKHIGSSLIVSGASGLTTVRFGALERLDSVDFSSLSKLRTVDFGAVEALSGSVRVASCDSIVGFSWLASVLAPEIRGNLAIENNANLTSLSDLSGVTSIAGSLRIVSNSDNLNDLQGLHNLLFVVGGMHLEGSSITDLSPLSQLTSLGGSLTVERTLLRAFDESFAPVLSGDAFRFVVSNNAFLESFTSNSSRPISAPSITVQSGSNIELLSVVSNPALQSLQGLGGFTHVVDLEIRDNSALETLDGLQNLVHVDVLATVQDNANLVHLDALLQNFDTSSFVGLVFDGNKPCVRPIVGCEVYAGPDLVVEFGFEVGANASDFTETETSGTDGSEVPADFWSNIREIQASLTFEGPSAEAGATLPIAPRLERIGGSLTLRNGIASIAGLSKVASVGKDLTIASNARLTSLAGLETLQTVAGSVLIEDNDMLQSLVPLSLQSIGFNVEINSNEVLDTFEPLLDSLADGQINGDVTISNNAALTTLGGLRSVHSITGAFQISNNADLLSLDGCETLQSIASGKITFLENAQLNDVDSFNWAIASGSSVDLTFSDNAACLMPQSGCRTLLPRVEGDNTLAFDYDSAYFATVGLAYTLRRSVSPRTISVFPATPNSWNCNSGSERRVAQQRVMCMKDCSAEDDPVVVAGHPSCMAPCVAPAVQSTTDPDVCIEYVELSVSHASTDKAEFWATAHTVRMNMEVPATYAGDFQAPQLTVIEGDLILDSGMNLNESLLAEKWSMFPSLTTVTGTLRIAHQSGGTIDLLRFAPNLATVGAFELVDNDLDTDKSVDLSVLSHDVSVGSLVIRNTNITKLFTVTPPGGVLQSLHICGAPLLSDLSALAAVSAVKNVFAIASTAVTSLSPLKNANEYGSHQVVIHDNKELVDLAGIMSRIAVQNVRSSLVYGGPVTCSSPQEDCQVFVGASSRTITISDNSESTMFAKSVTAVIRADVSVNFGGPTYLASERQLFVSDSEPGTAFAPYLAATQATQIIELPESAALQEALSFRRGTFPVEWDPLFRTARESNDPLEYRLPVVPGSTYTLCLPLVEVDLSVTNDGQRVFNISVSTMDDTTDSDDAFQVVDTYGYTSQLNKPFMICLRQIVASNPWLHVRFERTGGATKPIRIFGMHLTLPSSRSTYQGQMYVTNLPVAPAFEALRVLEYDLRFTIAVGSDQSDGAHGPRFPKLEWASDVRIYESCLNLHAPIMDFASLEYTTDLYVKVWFRDTFNVFNALKSVRTLSLINAFTGRSADMGDDILQSLLATSVTDIEGFQSLQTVTNYLHIDFLRQRASGSRYSCDSVPSDFTFPGFTQISGFSSLEHVAGMYLYGAQGGLHSLTSLDGFSSVQEIGHPFQGFYLPAISWEGFTQIKAITGAVSIGVADTIAQRMFGLGHLATTSWQSAGLLKADFPEAIYCSGSLEGQSKWVSGFPHAAGNGVSFAFRDFAEFEHGYLYAVEKRAHFIGGAAPSDGKSGCSGDRIDKVVSWIDVANGLGRDVRPKEVVKFMVYPVGIIDTITGANNDVTVEEEVLGLEAASFLTIPYFGVLVVNVRVAVPETDVPTEDSSADADGSLGSSAAGGVPRARVRVCWSLSLDASDCHPIGASFRGVTDAEGKLEVPSEQFYIPMDDVPAATTTVYVFATALAQGDRLLNCSLTTSATAAIPSHTCVHVLQLPDEVSSTSPPVITMNFEDSESVAVHGRVSLRNTYQHTKSGNSCPTVGATVEITGPLAKDNEIKSTSDGDGTFMLTIVGGGSNANDGSDYVTGELFVILEGHEFALADPTDPTGERTLALSRDAFATYLMDDQLPLLQFRILPPKPGRDGWLALSFRMHVSVRGLVELNIVDITKPRVVTINAQQGLCTSRRMPLSSSRQTAIMFVGGTDTESWCPDFDMRYQLQPGRVVATIPLPAIPVVSFVALAPTARQQAYFDYMGTQALALNDPNQAPYAVNWIYRSKPRIEVVVKDHTGSEIVSPPASCVSTGTLEASDRLYVVGAHDGDPTSHNVELEVTVNEYYDDVACSVVPGLFTMTNHFDDIVSAPAADDDGDTDVAEVVPQDCAYYIAEGEVVPPDAACKGIVVSTPWPQNIKLRATRPASASPSKTDPMDFVWPTGVSLAFQAVDAHLVSTAAGLQAVAVEPAQRTPRQTATWEMANALIQGEYELSKFFSVLLPRQHPLLYLYKPPGDMSYSELEKGTVLRAEYSAGRSITNGHRFDIKAMFGAGLENGVCAGLGFAACLRTIETGFTVGPYFSSSSDTGPELSGSFVVETQVKDTIRTGDVYPEQDTITYDPRFEPGNGDRDVFVGLGTTTVYEKKRDVSFDAATCLVAVKDIVNLEEIDPNANTLEVQQIYDIKYRVLPELQGMRDNNLVSGSKLKEVEAAIAEWERVLKEHADRRDTLFGKTGVAAGDDGDQPEEANFWKGKPGQQLLSALRRSQASHHIPPFVTRLGYPSDSHQTGLATERISRIDAFLEYDTSKKRLGSTRDTGLRPLHAELGRLLAGQRAESPAISDVQAASTALNNINMISFSGGGHQYEHEYHSSTETSNGYGMNLDFMIEAGVEAGGSLVLPGFQMDLEGHGGFAHTVSLHSSLVRDEASPMTVKFVLGDDDLGDYYDVAIHEDPTTGMPMFETVSGRSSCPNSWQTVPRERIEVLRREFVIYDADPEQPVVLKVPIVNTSPTDEMFPYVVIQNATTNQKGLQFRAFGNPVTEEFVPVYLLPFEITNVEFEIRRPAREEPEYFDFEDVAIVIASPCNWHNVYTSFAVTIHYMKPCPPIEWVGALANDWTVERQGVGESTVPSTTTGLLQVPDDGLVLAVRNPHWQIGSWSDATHLESVVVQSRPVGGSEWTTISDELKFEPETNWGEVIVRNVWPNQAPNMVADGLYDLRGITKCKKAGGIRSDHLKYSVTPPRRVAVGAGQDPIDALRAELNARLNQIVVANDAVLCDFDAEISKLNNTLDTWTEGACSLQDAPASSAQGTADSSDSELQSQQSHLSSFANPNRRNIVCDGKQLKCCGNGVLEADEQCDVNGESEACIDCIITQGWSCINELGEASKCVKLDANTTIDIGYGSTTGGPNQSGVPPPSVSMDDGGAVGFEIQFPAGMLPPGQNVAMSLPVVEDTPSNLIGGVVLRIEPTATPSFVGGPIELVLKMRAPAPCDPTMRLRLFDTDLDTWVDAAKTCGEGSARYKSDFDTSTCTLVTHVCHLTDFAAFTPEPIPSESTNVGAIVGGVFGALAGVVLIVFVARHVHRQRQEYMVKAEKDTSAAVEKAVAGGGLHRGSIDASMAAMARTKSGHVLQPMSILRRGMSQQSLEMMPVGVATTVSMDSGIGSNLAFVNEVEMDFETDLEAGPGSAAPAAAARPIEAGEIEMGIMSLDADDDVVAQAAASTATATATATSVTVTSANGDGVEGDDCHESDEKKDADHDAQPELSQIEASLNTDHADCTESESEPEPESQSQSQSQVLDAAASEMSQLDSRLEMSQAEASLNADHADCTASDSASDSESQDDGSAFDDL